MAREHTRPRLHTIPYKIRHIILNFHCDIYDARLRSHLIRDRELRSRLFHLGPHERHAPGGAGLLQDPVHRSGPTAEDLRCIVFDLGDDFAQVHLRSQHATMCHQTQTHKMHILRTRFLGHAPVNLPWHQRGFVDYQDNIIILLLYLQAKNGLCFVFCFE